MTKGPLEAWSRLIWSNPQAPLAGLLTVVSTVNKLHFKHVGFELQKLTKAGFFTAFICLYSRVVVWLFFQKLKDQIPKTQAIFFQNSSNIFQKLKEISKN